MAFFLGEHDMYQRDSVDGALSLEPYLGSTIALFIYFFVGGRCMPTTSIFCTAHSGSEISRRTGGSRHSHGNIYSQRRVIHDPIDCKLTAGGSRDLAREHPETTVRASLHVSLRAVSNRYFPAIHPTCLSACLLSNQMNHTQRMASAKGGLHERGNYRSPGCCLPPGRRQQRFAVTGCCCCPTKKLQYR